MSIRGWVLAAMAAVGFGSGAQAATVHDYDLWLRYDGTAFINTLYYEAGPDGEMLAEGDFAANAMLPGMRSYLFGDLAIGDVIRLAIQIVHPDVPDEYDPYHGNGGRTPICQIGIWDCAKTNFTGKDSMGQRPDDGFFIAWDDIWDVDGGSEIGAAVRTSLWGRAAVSPYTSSDGLYWWWFDFENSYFTVVEGPAVAPVPLPASAALLPLGLGALAMMRKRRRKVS